ncbi:MAG TPA: hypothetical protein VEU29_07035, partial [Actinomycetota bacterium]|nr:hypothetical protein [Actinomycetota bacterium]
LSAPDDSLTEMKWRSVMAKILARRGDVDQAVALVHEAAAIGSATGYLDWYAGVLVDVAEVEAVAARAPEAIDALRRSAGLYARKGNVISAAAVEGRLREASPA